MIRVGVLGLSSIARRRAIPALRSCPDTELAGIASRGPDHPGYDELLERSDVDAVYLSLPNALHEPWGERVLRAGKHLLVEKPAATTAGGVRRLVELAADRGLVLRENFAFLHHGQHRAVTDLVAAGRLGPVRSFTAAFCFPPLPPGDIRYAADLGGGALLDAGVYPVRAAQLLLGNDLAVAGAVLREDPQSGVDVAGQALLVSGAGVTASLQFGFEHSYGAFYTLWGSRARLHLDRAFSPPPAYRPVLHIDEQDHAEQLVLPAADQFERSVSSFAAAIRDGRGACGPEQLAHCADTIRTLELVDGIRDTALRKAYR